MRSNAPITAFLALAVLSFLPGSSLAKTTHRHVSTQKISKTSKSGKKAAAAPVSESHTAKRRTGSKAVASRTSEPHPHALRVSERRSTHKRRHEAANEQAKSTRREKATSADFLRAASAHKAASKSAPTVSAVRPAPEPRITAAAATPEALPTLYNQRGRLIVPPALKGSHEILVHQNIMADHDGLSRIQDDDDLLNMRRQGLLVPLPADNFLEVDDRLPANRRFCRSWTAQFLADLARAHYAHFHTTLQVNSAVRTVEFQQHLMHINGNAAPFEGDTASPHLTGQAVDIAKHGLSLTEIAWLRGYLLPLVQQGKIDVEEEFQQSCFHISVYKRYLPSGEAPRRNLAATHHSETSDLAAAMR